MGSEVKYEGSNLTLNSTLDDLSTSTEQTKELMKRVFDLKELNEEILSKLDLSDLKSARRVNSQWRKLSTNLLIQRNCTRIILLALPTSRSSSKLNFYGNTSRGLHMRKVVCNIPYPSNHLETLNLSELNDLLRKSLIGGHVFPCTDFKFIGGNLSDPQVRQFFSIFGHQVKTLHLTDIGANITVNSELGPSSITPKSVFFDLIKNQVPNVENLSIRGFTYSWTEGQMVQLSLPSLKVFTWKRQKDISIDGSAVAIMRAAPNLQLIRTKIADHLDALVATVEAGGKLGAIKDLMTLSPQLGGDIYFDPKSLSQLAQIGLTLEKLLIGDIRGPCDLSRGDYNQVKDAYNEILSTSKDTLNHLVIRQLPLVKMKMTHLMIPPLKKLTTLSLGKPLDEIVQRVAGLRGTRSLLQPQSMHPQLILPKGLNLKDTFPNLHTLLCDSLRCHDDLNWSIYFPQNLIGQLDTVKLLSVPDECTMTWIRKLGSLCPNFQTLRVRGDGSGLTKTLPIVFNELSHLQGMEIEIVKLQPSIECLDSTFTGLNQNVCNLLRSGRKVNRNRLGPSLLDLKCLRRLKISIKYHIQWISVESSPVFISNVSGLYAFKLMPDLAVTISYDQTAQQVNRLKEMLAPLEPYVSFEHNFNLFGDMMIQFPS